MPPSFNTIFAILAMTPRIRSAANRKWLCDLLKTIEADLIEHECKQDRHDGSKCNSQHTQTDRIDHGLTEQPVCECLLKIVKAHKLSLPYRKCKAVWLYLLKRHCPPPQRNIFKDDEPDDKRYRINSRYRCFHISCQLNFCLTALAFCSFLSSYRFPPLFILIIGLGAKF